MSEISKINIDSTEYDIHDAKPHGTLTAPLIATGGDGEGGAVVGKIILDPATAGQITNDQTSTLFGFISNGATEGLMCGSTAYALNLRGSATRPSYLKSGGSAKDLALKEDVPSNILTLSSRSAYDCNTRYDGKVWLVAAGSNCPSGLSDQYGSLFTMPYRQASGNAKPDFGTQIFIPNGDDQNKPNSMFYRTSLANTWNPWQEVAVEGKANADKIDGYHVSVVSELPASPDSNTVYIVV